MKKKYTKIWGEHISLKEFLSAFSISIAAIIICLAICNWLFKNDNLQLLFGLFGALIGFFINTFLFKPKRAITLKENDNDDN